MTQKNQEKYEKLVESHMASKLEAAQRLQELSDELNLTRIQRIEICEIIALLTSTEMETWLP